VVIVLAALGPSGPLFDQRAVTRFQEGKTLLLPMVLLASCRDVLPCDTPAETCRQGACGSDRYDSLDEVVPGEEREAVQRPPMRLSDAGVDGGVVDAARPDATADAGGFPDAMPPDTGVVRDAMVPDMGIAMDATVPPDSGMTGPATCVVTTDCDLQGACPPDAQDCVCRQTPQGMVCVPTCSAADPSCPMPPMGTFRCDTVMGVCVPN
jgi:hypothetical protein